MGKFAENKDTPTLSAVASFKSGGTTGYFSAAYVDKLVDRCGKELHLIVDRVYGLSVGAINAAALWPLRETGNAIHTAKSLRAFYHRHTNDIFDSKFWSFGGLLGNLNEVEKLERILEREMGNLMLSDFCDGLGVLVVDAETKLVKILTSDEAVDNPDADFLMVDLLRASSAAPFYYDQKPIVSESGKLHQFTDAGFVCPDQSYNVYKHVRSVYGDVNPPLFINIGTGKVDEPARLEDWPAGVRQTSSAIKFALAVHVNEVIELMTETLGDNYVELDIPAGPMQMDSRIEILRRYIEQNTALIEELPIDHIVKFVHQKDRQVQGQNIRKRRFRWLSGLIPHFWFSHANKAR